MKTILAILSFFILVSIKGQNKSIDTLYANDTKTVSLFFPKPIRQGIVGKSHFVFSYNKDKEQYFGLLQANPGVNSNLLAITNDGQIYSYILKYSKRLTKLNYFIAKDQSIGNEIPKVKKKQKIKKEADTIQKLDEIVNKIYAKNCTSFLKNSRREINQSKKKNQIKLTAKDIAYQNGALYYLIEIQNKSIIDYDINYLRFFTENKSGLTQKSSQKLQIKPVFICQFPQTIKAHSKKEFVMVLPKFSVDNHKNIIIELNELEGERKLEMKLNQKNTLYSN